jgi:membrane protease YdiL (CAAX protease family)
MSNSPNRRKLVALGIAFELGLAGIAWLAGWYFNSPPLRRFHWNLQDAGVGALMCIPLLLVFFLLVWKPVGPLLKIKRFFDVEIRPIFGDCTFMELTAVSLAAGFGEELLFRGVLQELLIRWIGTWWGLAVTSLLFGLVHPITGVYVLIAGLFGAYLGICLLTTDNLLVVIIAHALYDFIALSYLVKLSYSDSIPALSKTASGN